MFSKLIKSVNALFKDKTRLAGGVIVLGVALVWNIFAYGGGRLIASSWRHYDMTTPVDGYIPFLPWTITIYFGCYIVWGVNYLICAFREREGRDRYFCADFIAKGVCFLFFVLLPTTNVRPEVAGETVWDALMRLLYHIDSADNLFPSIHCVASWLCWIGVRGRKEIPAAYRGFSLIAAVAVCISTMTTRQHVIADVVMGVLLAEGSYFLAGQKSICGVYSAFISRLQRKLCL